jgi:hypothetical protein
VEKLTIDHSWCRAWRVTRPFNAKDHYADFTLKQMSIVTAAKCHFYVLTKITSESQKSLSVPVTSFFSHGCVPFRYNLTSSCPKYE